ncbi:MAG: type I restriction endonuclease subunit R [Methanosphaera sp.]|nr:type I restriction endonuclease subunit R [Methanosphaera sp.]
MSSESEKQLEDKLVNDLASNGYELVTIRNDEELEENFRLQLEKFNDITFSDDEFEKILTRLKQGGIYDKAKLLRDSYTLKRDGQPDKWIRFINKEEWCKNIFQVAHQITSENKHKYRYDVTILINGLPLVQIELKKRGVEIEQAFNQIKERYLPTFKGLFQYIQIFVISNGVNTKYFSTGLPKTVKFENTYFWKDEENNNIKQLSEFSQTFLEKCNLAKMITQFMILNDIDKNVMVLRAYQKYAVERIVEQATKIKQNGYVWHTTGSGKTLTSFKASQLLAEDPSIDKVIFVVDRQDLDHQTIKRFNQYSKDSVEKVYNTNALIRALNRSRTDLIVTTIQKLNIVVTKYKNKLDDGIQDKRIIFIYDECHRSQFGGMHQNITDFFHNSLCYGFTGTPIFTVNAGQDKTTKSIFGQRLHTYMIKDAIRDNNVLGFATEYYGPKLNKDELRVLKNDTEALMDDERLSANVDIIKKTYNHKTYDGEFNAMFSVANGGFIHKYYKLLQEKYPELKVAVVYTINENKKYDGVSDRAYMAKYMDDYNKMFNTKHNTEDFNSYKIDVTNKMENTEIDLLLVKDMFTTGFDAPKLNTLYLDKNLEYHMLIQTFSRTNRIYNSKKAYGNIISFRDISDETDEALRLFSNDSQIEDILMKPYKELIKDFDNAYHKLSSIAPTVDEANNIESETELKEYIKAFRELNNIKSKLDTFPEFTFDDVMMDEQEFNDHRSIVLDKYDEIKRDPDKYPELLNINFEIELLGKDIINVDYILGLLKELNVKEDNYPLEKERTLGIIHQQVPKNKWSVYEKFIERYIEIMGIDNVSLDEQFYEFLSSEKENELEELIETEDLLKNEFKNLIDEYNFSGKMDNKTITNTFKDDTLRFKERISKRDQVKDKIFEIYDKYE